MVDEPKSNIRNIEYFRNGFWQWAPYNDCFYTIDNHQIGIRISDIDGHVERNGHFLWVETTRRDVISLGQMKSIRHRVARGDTAVIVYGEPNDPKKITIFRPHSEGKTFEINQRQLWLFFRGWMLWAESNGFIHPKNWKP